MDARVDLKNLRLTLNDAKAVRDDLFAKHDEMMGPTRLSTKLTGLQAAPASTWPTMPHLRAFRAL